MTARVLKWNEDKPHRCPECHVVADAEHVARWKIVRCCRCETAFTRWPRLSLLLPYAGVVCAEHR